MSLWGKGVIWPDSVAACGLGQCTFIGWKDAEEDNCAKVKNSFGKGAIKARLELFLRTLEEGEVCRLDTGGNMVFVVEAFVEATALKVMSLQHHSFCGDLCCPTAQMTSSTDEDLTGLPFL